MIARRKYVKLSAVMLVAAVISLTPVRAKAQVRRYSLGPPYPVLRVILGPCDGYLATRCDRTGKSDRHDGHMAARVSLVTAGEGLLPGLGSASLSITNAPNNVPFRYSLPESARSVLVTARLRVRSARAWSSLPPVNGGAAITVRLRARPLGASPQDPPSDQRTLVSSNRDVDFPINCGPHGGDPGSFVRACPFWPPRGQGQMSGRDVVLRVRLYPYRPFADVFPAGTIIRIWFHVDLDAMIGKGVSATNPFVLGGAGAPAPLPGSVGASIEAVLWSFSAETNG